MDNCECGMSMHMQKGIVYFWYICQVHMSGIMMGNQSEVRARGKQQYTGQPVISCLLFL